MNISRLAEVLPDVADRVHEIVDELEVCPCHAHIYATRAANGHTWDCNRRAIDAEIRRIVELLRGKHA